MKTLLSILLLGFASVSLAGHGDNLSEQDINNMKLGAGNLLTCSVAIRDSFSLMDTIPDAVNEDGDAVEVRLHSISGQMYDAALDTLSHLGMKEDMVIDITAGKHTQWLYLTPEEKGMVLHSCSEALSQLQSK